MENPKFTKQVTDLGKYCSDAQVRVAQQAERIRKQMLEDVLIWGGGESVRGNEKYFDPLSGSISLSEKDLKTDFFRNSLRMDTSGESQKNRGLNYYISINPLRNNQSEKLLVIEQDVQDLKIALSREDISWREKTALLDYVKQHALTLYHAIQYPLRFGVLLPSRQEAILKNAQNTATVAVSGFYNHLLGYSTDTDYVNLLDTTLQQAKSISMQPDYFKIQELDHPLIILGNAYGNAVAHSNTDVLIGVPSGGTQIAVVTQLCMNKNGLSPELAFVPVSTHSAKKADRRDMTDARLDKLVVELGVEDKNVLVLEDNSNTGTTLSRIGDAIERQMPSSLHVSVAELDPLRVRVKARGKPVMATDVEHPDFSTAVGIVPITRSFLPDRQIRKARAQRIVYRGLEVVENNHIKPLDGAGYKSVCTSPGFLKFEEKYKHILREVGDKHGYRNPYMIALQLYRTLTPSEYKKNMNTSYEREIISAISTAAVQYPYIPDILRKKLSSTEEIAEYESGKLEPWMILGAKDMIDACFSVVKKCGGRVYIWTKGDSHRIGYGKLPGAGEQAKRFTISGLADSVKKSLAEHGLSEKNFKFLALPDKSRVIGEVVCPDAKAIDGSIFIIDDMLENIKTASSVARDCGINTETFLMDDQHLAQSLGDAATLVREMNTPFFFVLDMDDTLLHEEFRREHQPVNVYLEMQRLGLIK